MNKTDVDSLISRVLGVPIDSVDDGLAFNSVPEWDSLNHVNLMLALEESYGLEIDEDTMVQLIDVLSIRSFVTQNS